MIKKGTIHSPQVGESWQHTKSAPWTITEVTADGDVRGQRPKSAPTLLTLGNVVTDTYWKRVQAATPEPGHRADPAPDERTGIVAIRCKDCRGVEFRRAKEGEVSAKTRKQAFFVCVTCEQLGNNISAITNDLYEDSPLLAPITLKELDALEVPTPVTDDSVELDLCGCGHVRGMHDAVGRGACGHHECPCEQFHAFCVCGHAQGQHQHQAWGDPTGPCCAFPPELTGTDQCPCTNFRPKRSAE